MNHSRKPTSALSNRSSNAGLVSPTPSIRELTWLVCLAALTGVAHPRPPTPARRSDSIIAGTSAPSFRSAGIVGQKKNCCRCSPRWRQDAREGIRRPRGGRPAVMVCAADQKFIYDDGATKTFENASTTPISRTFQTYPLTETTDRLPQDFDPDVTLTFFLALYGGSESALVVRRSNFADTRWICALRRRRAPRCLGRPGEVFTQRAALRVYVNWPAPLTGEKSPGRNDGVTIPLAPRSI